MEDKFTLSWPGILKSGVFMALVIIGYSVIQYVFNLMTISLYAASIIGISMFFLNFACLWIFSNMYKKNHTGAQFSWSNAFVASFLIGFTAAVVSSIYSFIFSSFIDPDYQVKVMEELRYMSEEMYMNMGMEEEQIQQQLARFDNAKDITPIKQFTQGLIYGVIGTGILSLIVALIIRKKNPVFD